MPRIASQLFEPHGVSFLFPQHRFAVVWTCTKMPDSPLSSRKARDGYFNLSPAPPALEQKGLLHLLVFCCCSPPEKKKETGNRPPPKKSLKEHLKKKRQPRQLAAKAIGRPPSALGLAHKRHRQQLAAQRGALLEGGVQVMPRPRFGASTLPSNKERVPKA